VRSCQGDTEFVFIHQDAFAAGYNEYELLGWQLSSPDFTAKKFESSGRIGTR
jgi:hypothetical protein